jgi:putative peptide zinc metalloprotease protein
LWHRVEKLKPRLREDVAIERQVVRDEVWYVVRDQFSTRVHRFSPAVYFVLTRMDGSNTFDMIWRDAVAQFGEDAPSQDQVLQTASQLYQANILQSDAPVDEYDLSERAIAERSRLFAFNLKNPMFVRIPLFDPDRFLDATLHLFRPFCNWLGALAWLGVVGWLALQIAINWDDLTTDLVDKVLAAQSLVAIILIYPLLKILHEFGHAYATKLAGQEVHEMGVMLLTLLPAPYVDASASAMVTSKWQRALIAAAGMMVELVVAAGAMLIWQEAETGPVRSLAYDALLIASVSTVIFNGNPLLRFDAYYMLCDVLELPNLGTRAQRYYLYLVQRYLFGAPDVRSPAMARGERFWFALYAPASLAYRLFTLFSIALFVSSKYFAVGIALAIWVVAASVLWPIAKALKFVVMSPALARMRWRAVSVTAAGVAAVAALVAIVPIPNGTVARGMVWIPEEARVVAYTSGSFDKFLAEPGAPVAKGEALVQLEDPFKQAKLRDAEEKVTEIEARLRSAEARSPFDSVGLAHQRDLIVKELEDIQRRDRDLVMRSPAAGIFVVPHAVDLADNFIKQGQSIGYVMSEGTLSIRVSVPESQIQYVRDQTRAVAIRFDEQPWVEIDNVTIERQVPESSRKLPSPALSAANGGTLDVDPAAKEKDKIIEPIFEIDLSLPSEYGVGRWGQRVWVRFDHGASPVIGRIYRAARQLFLGRFHV